MYEKKLVPLVKLRHCVVHRVAAFRESGEWPELISPYKDRIAHKDGHGLHWTKQLFTCQTAKWAVDAAIRTHLVLQEALPAETPQEKIRTGFLRWNPPFEDSDVS